MERRLACCALAMAMIAAGTVCATEDADLTALTNSITARLNTFNTFLSGNRPRRKISNAIFDEIDAITNLENRLVAARHFANELLHVNVSNENYSLRGRVLREMANAFDSAYCALEYANAPEHERLTFLFDALEYYKYGCYLTTYEELITEPLYGDYGRIAQRSCMEDAYRMDQARTHLGFTRYRDLYPKLSPEGKEYFQTRYRAIFGKDFEMPQQK